MGRALCAKMKELLARQQADVAVQAAANNRIVARETIKVALLQGLGAPAGLHTDALKHFARPSCLMKISRWATAAHSCRVGR